MNREQYFFDSNFLIALLDQGDVHHPRSKEILADIETTEGRIFLSDVLINEVLSVLAKRCEAKKREAEFKKFAKLFQERIRDLPIACLYELLPEHLPQIIALMIQHDGCFNFHDALFIFFLRRLPKVHFVTFDRDFSKIEELQCLPA